MKIKILLLFFFLSINLVEYSYSQETYFYYSGDKKIPLNELPEKVYVKFEGKVDENKLNQLGFASRETIQFENENSFGAINAINRDVAYSYAIVSSNQSAIKNISNDHYTMPFFSIDSNIEVGISHLFTVRLKSSTDFALLDSIANANNVKIVGNHTFRPLWYTLSCDIGSKGNALQMANTFYETKLFQFAIPDIMEDIEFLGLLPPPSDPLFSTQWNFLNTGQSGGTPNADINITGAWDITKGASNIVVAILDLGLQSNHPDLTNISPISYDADLGQSPAYCCLQHGMVVGGIVGADHNSDGIAGTSPDSPLMSITNSNVSSPSIRKKWADAIDFAWLNGASIINCSWGFYVDYPEIEEAIDNATSLGRGNKGAIVVAASGKHNLNELKYPAAYPKTIAVGATDRNDQKSTFSNYGSGLDIVAPGTDIPTLN
ncbi:S8 family serine peptidase [Lunatimonas salinarum]|uniref:S8 family serine peptidase n=1 Tax=Lunatimonas salinarum TaxID=1774590 RepID=UPI001ADFC892|nr:S8 family serine peptidase [Lunatimonas salinarum]